RYFALPSTGNNQAGSLESAGRVPGITQSPTVANSSNPTANNPFSIRSQYTTRALDFRLPSIDRTFSRNSLGSSWLSTTRAPCALTFSVIHSRAGSRASTLERSTVTFNGLRFSARMAADGIGTPLHYGSRRELDQRQSR